MTWYTSWVPFGLVWKKARCEHDGKEVRRAAAARALPHRRCKPRRDLHLGSPPSFAMARTNVSNLAYNVIVVTEHNDGLQHG